MKTKANVKKIKHCCKDMDSSLKEDIPSIFYNPVYREYFIELKSPRNAKLGIYNCPWCGNKFPKSLVVEYSKILFKEFEAYHNPYEDKYFKVIIKEDFTDDVDFDLPEEFKTDEWWKNRKL